MMMNRRAVLVCAVAALLSGCASTQPRITGQSAAPASEQVALDRRGHRDPALLFATPEMQQMLAQRGLAPGFVHGDWEYGRSDARLSVGAPPARTGYGVFEIWQYDRLYDYSGRPRNSSRTTVRSVKSGVSR